MPGAHLLSGSARASAGSADEHEAKRWFGTVTLEPLSCAPLHFRLPVPQGWVRTSWVFDLRRRWCRDEALIWSINIGYEGDRITGFLFLYADLGRCRAN